MAGPARAGVRPATRPNRVHSERPPPSRMPVRVFRLGCVAFFIVSPHRAGSRRWVCRKPSSRRLSPAAKRISPPSHASIPARASPAAPRRSRPRRPRPRPSRRSALRVPASARGRAHGRTPVKRSLRPGRDALHLFACSFRIRVFASLGGYRPHGVTENRGVYGHRGCRRAQIRGGRHIGPPGDASRSVFGGRRLRRVDTVRIGGGGGSMIRHAPEPAPCPVDPVPVAVIVPFPPGFSGVSGWRPAFVCGALCSGSRDCSICGPCNNDGRSRTPGHSRAPGKPLERSGSSGVRIAALRWPEQPRRAWPAWSYLYQEGRLVPSPRHKKRDRRLTAGVLPYWPRRPPRAQPESSSFGGPSTAQSPHCRRHRSAVSPGAPCLCIGPLPVMGVFTDSVEAPSGPRTTPGAVRPAP